MEEGLARLERCRRQIPGLQRRRIAAIGRNSACGAAIAATTEVLGATMMKEKTCTVVVIFEHQDRGA